MPQIAELSQCDKTGMEVSLYLSTGTCTTPVWIFHKGVVGDLSLSETEDESELTSRDPAVIVRQYAEGKIDLEISGEQVVDSDYEGCNFINSMRARGVSRDVCILTGFMSEVGSVGWRGKFRNFDRSISGPESGAARQTFRLKPAACTLAECKVRPVRVGTANAVAEYTPETFTPTV